MSDRAMTKIDRYLLEQKRESGRWVLHDLERVQILLITTSMEIAVKHYASLIGNQKLSDPKTKNK
jgi:hypothetical protein